MEEAIKLLQEADKIIDLGSAGYAKATEVDETEVKLKAFLKQSVDPNTLFGRKFDKWDSGTHWKIVPRGKYADKNRLSMLQTLRDFYLSLSSKRTCHYPQGNNLLDQVALILVAEF